MLKSYFKTAWRNLIRNSGYSALNILGLATGMAVALLIGLWAHKEYSFDKFLPDSGQLYQVRRNFNANGEILNFTSTSLKLADALRNQVPEIQYVAETGGFDAHVLSIGDKRLSLKGGVTASDFLSIFQYPLISGNARTVLRDPYSIVLTESAARALFGNTNPVDRSIRFDNKHDLKVTGVLKDIPVNSTFQFKYLVPFSYQEANDQNTRDDRKGSFGDNNYNIFVRLKPGISQAQVVPKIRLIETSEKGNTNAMLSRVILQPLRNWHLYGNYQNGIETAGFLEYVRMFVIIGSLVLLIACINFVNLTTAHSEKRAREVGVRKSVGGKKTDIIFQFLIESILLTLIAFFFSLLFVELVLPAFNALTSSQLSIPFSDFSFWSIVLPAVLITALAAGSRPAFYLSSFNPVKVLKGTMKTGKAATLPRKILVSLQFTCSVALIISTIIVYQQIRYTRNRPSGYDANRLMMTNMNEQLGNNYTAVKNELIRRRVVSSVTMSSSPATDIYWHSNVDRWAGKQPGETIEMGTILTGNDYFRTLGMNLTAGRDFDGISDTNSVILNEAAVRRMRLKDPLNQIITFHGAQVRIVGIARDALMISPFAPPDPTLFWYNPYPQNIMMYRPSPNLSTAQALTAITGVFQKYNPDYPFEFEFADTGYAAKFNLELLVGKLAGIFAGLAIFISCLGLFGLSAFTAEQRTKEIGIRKVLGASISQVWFLLTKDFVGLVLISCLIASPVALYFLHGWLQKYDYRVGISPWVFVAAALTAMVITLITISFQAIRAAIANPVKSLKTE
jgi:putative ABC transport system permease protein